MAREIDEEYVRSLRFPNLPVLHGLIRARPLITRLRRVERMVRTLAPAPAPAKLDDVISPAFDAAGAHYREHGWCFVDPFFAPGVHQKLVETWPRRCFLEPPSDVFKSYDRGLEWLRGKSDPPNLERHPILRSVFENLRSEEVGRRVSAFTGGKHDLSCYSIICTRTWPGSNVAPHRDTTAYLPEGEHFLNMVIFIDGTGGLGSGGLSILGDSSFDKTMFRSEKLRNTALIYATSAPFFHGFEPVQLGKFRWALLTQFCDRAYSG
jgi:hypothetical protein